MQDTTKQKKRSASVPSLRGREGEVEGSFAVLDGGFRAGALVLVVRCRYEELRSVQGREGHGGERKKIMKHSPTMGKVMFRCCRYLLAFHVFPLFCKYIYIALAPHLPAVCWVLVKFFLVPLFRVEPCSAGKLL